MTKLEDLKPDSEVTHVFFNRGDSDEIKWLLKIAGISNFKIYSGRKVLKNQIHELKSLYESARNREIETM